MTPEDVMDLVDYFLLDEMNARAYAHAALNLWNFNRTIDWLQEHGAYDYPGLSTREAGPVIRRLVDEHLATHKSGAQWCDDCGPNWPQRNTEQ